MAEFPLPSLRPLEPFRTALSQWLAVPLWVPTGKDSVPTDSGHSVRVLLDPAGRLELGALASHYRYSEGNHRGFYRRWADLMTGAPWAELNHCATAKL